MSVSLNILLLNNDIERVISSMFRVFPEGGGGDLAAFLMVIMGAYLFSVKGKLIVT